MDVTQKIRDALLVGVAIFSLGLNAKIQADALRCQSAASLDLPNARIGGVRYAKGRACVSNDRAAKCDWEHTITRDETLRPAPGKEVRLVVIHSSHLTGSGAWDRVVVFDCISGLMNAVFEKSHLYGVKIEHAGNAELVFVSGKWAKEDPSCCPSEERSEVYRWDEKVNTFSLTGTIIRKR